MPTIKLEKRYPHIADEDVTEIFNAGYLQGWENARRKAIPIEWIKQWMVDNWELECNYGIEDMIDDWEEEQNERRGTDKLD